MKYLFFFEIPIIGEVSIIKYVFYKLDLPYFLKYIEIDSENIKGISIKNKYRGKISKNIIIKELKKIELYLKENNFDYQYKNLKLNIQIRI
jgi:hypothetical protein